jgi:hypothetical protein
MVRYVLQGKMNLMPDRDVKLLPMGEPAICTAGALLWLLIP